jgi:hypothetical protein
MTEWRRPVPALGRSRCAAGLKAGPGGHSEALPGEFERGLRQVHAGPFGGVQQQPDGVLDDLNAGERPGGRLLVQFNG